MVLLAMSSSLPKIEPGGSMLKLAAMLAITHRRIAHFVVRVAVNDAEHISNEPLCALTHTR